VRFIVGRHFIVVGPHSIVGGLVFYWVFLNIELRAERQLGHY
jgi:hypothetical protein